MKKLFFLNLIFLFSQLGITQTDVNQLLLGSWELATLEGEKGTQSTNAIVGNRWHFLSAGQLIMENEYGSLTVAIELDEESLSFQGWKFSVEITDENAFFISKETDGIAQRVGFKRLMDTTPPVLLTNQEKLGELRLDGFYYYVEDLDPAIYHYYRFYEQGELLQVSSVMSPEKIVPFLNRAYFSNSQDLRWNIFSLVPEETPGLVYGSAEIPSFSSKEEKRITTLTFAPDGETLDLSKVTRWESEERTYDRAFTLSYYPSNQLASWRGQDLTKDQPGLAEEVFLLPSLPASNIVNKSVEEMPRFPGCEEITDLEERKACAQKKLLEFIYYKVRYPTIASENGVEGTVVVSFVVEKNGSISNIKLLRNIGGGCGEEAVRVVKMMQAQPVRWSPGKMYGEPVRVQFILPVTFKLEGPAGEKRRRR